MYMNAFGSPSACCNAEIHQVDIHNINLLCTLHVYGCTLWSNPAYRAPKLLHTMRIYHTMHMNANGTPITCCNAEIHHVDIHNVTLLCTLHVYIWVHLMGPPCTSSAQALAHDADISYDVYERQWHTAYMLKCRETPCRNSLYYLTVHLTCIWVHLMGPPCSSSVQALAHDADISYDEHEHQWHTENMLQCREIPC
jgi:hypothetical protein